MCRLAPLGCLAGLILLLGAETECGAADPATKLPNLVIILADDLGYGDPSCYNARSKIPTPHIDWLASQGMRFTDAHTPSSVCTPTRYGLLTGRYCWRTRLKTSVLWAWDPPLIAADRLTLPAMLRQKGYHTSCIGKWHLGWDWPTHDGSNTIDSIASGLFDRKKRTALGKKIDFTKPLQGGPTTRGFDYYFGDDVPNFPPYCFIENDRLLGLPSQTKPNSMYGSPGPMVPGWDLAAVMPTLTTKAAEYIDRRAEDPSGKPFFLYMPLTAPHTPIAPAERFLGKSQAGPYGDFVHQVDWSVGQVLKALDRNGLAASTLVIFTSDNGSPARDGTKMGGPTGSVVTKYGHEPSRPWRGMKADIWDGGHRVPCIVRWPGQVTKNSISDALACLTDIMATMAAVVDFELPSETAEDSFNLLPLLRGNSLSHPVRRSVVHHSINGTFALREGKWKLIVNNLGSGGFTRPGRIKPKPGDPQGQLYHLGDDPGETNNLWTQRPAVVERLRAQLDQIRGSGGTRPTTMN